MNLFSKTVLTHRKAVKPDNSGSDEYDDDIIMTKITKRRQIMIKMFHDYDSKGSLSNHQILYVMWLNVEQKHKDCMCHRYFTLTISRHVNNKKIYVDTMIINTTLHSHSQINAISCWHHDEKQQQKSAMDKKLTETPAYHKHQIFHLWWWLEV